MVDLKTEYESVEEWLAKGQELFGPNRREWVFVCPSCKHITKVQDWFDAGDKEGEVVAFNCVGRLLGSKNEL